MNAVERQDADTAAKTGDVMCGGLVAPPLLDIGPPQLDGPIAVRAVSQHTAERWFGAYHYSGTIGPSPGARFFGIFRPDLAAVVAIGMGANEAGVARKLNLQQWRGNWEITRVAAHPDAPRNTTTAAIAAVLRILADAGVRWVFSYADTAQGHHGGIYQGLNAVYVGASPGEAGYLLDGVPVHPRSLVSRFGTRGEAVYELAAKCGQTLVKVPHLNAPKHTYVLPCGPLPVARQIRKHLRSYQRPYPKRAEEVSRVTRPDSIGEGGVRLPGSALGPTDEERRDDVVPMPVQVVPGPVIPGGRPGVSVTGSDLNIPKGNPGVQHGRDVGVPKGMGTDPLRDPGLLAQTLHDPTGHIPGHGQASGREQHVAFLAVPDCQVDGPEDRRGHRDRGPLMALAENADRAMTAFAAEVFDVDRTRFGHPEAQQSEHDDQGVVHDVGPGGDRQEMAHLHPVQPVRCRFVVDGRPADVGGGVDRDEPVEEGVLVEPRHRADPALDGGQGQAGFHVPGPDFDVSPLHFEQVQPVLLAPAEEVAQVEGAAGPGRFPVAGQEASDGEVDRLQVVDLHHSDSVLGHGATVRRADPDGLYGGATLPRPGPLSNLHQYDGSACGQ